MKVLVSIHRPDGYDYKANFTSGVMAAIDQVNDEMVAAGVRIFVCGLESRTRAKSIHWSPDGNLNVSDGHYIQSDQYVDGFWVLDVASIEDAVEWGRKAALACRGSVEVRPIH
jgi:hypothetical protein